MKKLRIRLALGIWIATAPAVISGCGAENKSSNEPTSAEFQAPPDAGANEVPPPLKASKGKTKSLPPRR
jgi:hypothetical protein